MTPKNENIVSFSLPSKGYKGEMKVRDFSIILDEPEDEGGTNLGMKPTEALEGALAGCIAITLRMYAERKEWDTGEITVKVYRSKNEHNEVEFHKIIEFEKANELTKQQLKRLSQISDHCPVSKLLQTVNPIIQD